MSPPPGTEEPDAQTVRLLAFLGRISAEAMEDDICRSFVEGAREVLGFDQVNLFLWEEASGTFRGTFGADAQGRILDEHERRLPLSPGSPADRIRQGAVIERQGLMGLPQTSHGEEETTADLVGLRCNGQLLGILCVDNRRSGRVISDWDLQAVQCIGQVLGLSLAAARARLALAENEERFRQMAEFGREWIGELDTKGSYTWCSPGIRTILGYDPGEVRGRPLTDFVAPEDRARLADELRKLLDGYSTRVRSLHSALRKEGGRVLLETSALPRVDANGRPTGIRGIHRDVTREQELENQLRHSQKLEAMGRLIGGVAHDFNNLLTTIIGTSSMILQDLRENDPLRPDLEKICLAGEQAAQLTNRLLVFSRTGEVRIQRLNVNAIIAGMEPLLRRTLGEHLRLLVQLDPCIGPVRGDEGYLQQVILQLVVNARDAMTDPDLLTGWPIEPDARAALIEQQRGRAHVLTLCTAVARPGVDAVASGPGVVLSVSDTGVGMPSVVKERLFEPFFTTRTPGRGSGLGLSTVRGMVQQFGGRIEAESECGVGTTVRIFLPAEPVTPPPTPPADLSSAPPRGEETILVVEDQPVVRDLVVRMLKSLGYQVLQAVDGREGLEVARRYPHPIHLVLSDMRMPNLDGKGFVEQLRRVRPDFKVLFISGYSVTDTVEGRVLGVEVPLITKPFTRDALARKVREVLDAP